MGRNQTHDRPAASPTPKQSERAASGLENRVHGSNSPEDCSIQSRRSHLSWSEPCASFPLLSDKESRAPAGQAGPRGAAPRGGQEPPPPVGYVLRGPGPGPARRGFGSLPAKVQILHENQQSRRTKLGKCLKVGESQDIFSRPLTLDRGSAIFVLALRESEC